MCNPGDQPTDRLLDTTEPPDDDAHSTRSWASFMKRGKSKQLSQAPISAVVDDGEVIGGKADDAVVIPVAPYQPPPITPPVTNPSITATTADGKHCVVRFALLSHRVYCPSDACVCVCDV